MFHDLKYGLRALAHAPATTLAAIAALALGIGANTALFTVFNAVLLRPMHYPHPKQVVELERSWPGEHGAAVTAYKFSVWRTKSHSFQDVAAYGYLPGGVNLTGRGQPERITDLPVTAGFFRVLDVQPQLGRTFTDAEDQPGAGHFVVLSNGVWRRRFHSDRNIPGRSITLDGADYTVLGVMPADFSFPESSEIWTPLQLTITAASLSNDYKVSARLNDGESQAHAR